MESTVIMLNNGVQMPKVGLGTYRASGQPVIDAVSWALESGISLIDTASIYKNGFDISTALQSSSVADQQAIFLTSKISPYEQGTEASAAAFEDIMKALGRVDLLLIHWPGASRVKPESEENAALRHQTWKVMEDLYLAGRIRAIGVSNFNISHLQLLLKSARVCPAVNQVEVHPLYQQKKLLEFCQSRGITVTAYGSLGSGSKALLECPVVLSIAEQAKRSPAQVLLRWGLQKGCAVIPKSVHKERIEAFSEEQLLNWNLAAEQMAMLDAMDCGEKFCWDPKLIH